MKKGLILHICIICLTIIGTAQTKLPLFFANGMVLQRNANATIWGTDAANRKVIVTGSWGKTDSVITNLAGKWKLTLETPAAGGPYTLTATGSTTVVINDILMGEVWLCSGQSNMEMPMKGYTASTPPQPVDSSAYFIANSLNPNLRVFTSGWNGTSTTPVDDLSVGSWKSASPTNTPDFSATAYFFARKLQEKLGVPVGIMVTARGGASIESWMDSATLATVKPVVIPNPVNWQTAQTTHTILYNTMLHPFIGYTLKGIIWSQGEANRANHFEYQEMLTKLIQSWRVKWNQGAFPFYFAEVAPNGGTANQNAAYLREAQLNTMLTTSTTGMASTMDIGVQGLDHYPKKKVIGDRLAEWALIKNYGQTYGNTSGPVVKSMTIRNDTINIKFDYIGIGLVAGGSGLTDFEIAGANRVFYTAIATIANDGMSVNVKSTSVASPLYVNYAFKNFVVGSLFNSDGLPAPSFRVENVLTVLPIKFGNISATQKNGERTIVWNTLTESNIDHFELQHSTDGNNFSFLTKVMAKNTSANYKYEDKQNHNNQVVYYRIKVYHTNGSSTYSSIVKSTIFDKANVVKFINPSYNGVSVFFPTAFTGSIVITDNLGRKIAVKQINHHFGLFNTSLPKAFKGTAVVQLNTTDHEMHSAIIHVL